MRRVVVAAPGYLARRGVPQVPSDLREHDALLYNFQPPEWTFRDALRQPVQGPFAASDGTILRQACLAGLGLMRTGDAVVAADLYEGRLVEVLTDYAPPEVETLHAVYAGHPHLASRIRAFVDFMAAHVSSNHVDPRQSSKFASATTAIHAG